LYTNISVEAVKYSNGLTKPLSRLIDSKGADVVTGVDLGFKVEENIVDPLRRD
jgi:hypothetical protein